MIVRTKKVILEKIKININNKIIKSTTPITPYSLYFIPIIILSINNNSVIAVPIAKESKNLFKKLNFMSPPIKKNKPVKTGLSNILFIFITIN